MMYGIKPLRCVCVWYHACTRTHTMIIEKQERGMYEISLMHMCKIVYLCGHIYKEIKYF